MKIAVLGAGVSGLTVARRLCDKGHEVVVYEKSGQVGGLARSRKSDGYIYDPHGGHIFNSKNQEVVDWVFSLLPKENWQFTIRNAKIFFSGRYVSYPFELSLCELDTEDAIDCAYDFIMGQKGERPSNYYDWLVWNFGESIAHKYMIPYNSKIWAYPLKEMETQWMEGKMPLPTKKEMLRSLLLKDPSERKMPHSTFYYPLHGGIQTMVDAIAKGLELRLSSNVKKLERMGNKWVVNGDDAFDEVVSTIPLPELANAYELPSSVANAVSDLKYNSLTTILCKCPKTNISWLYVPEAKYKMHRIGFQSSLTPYATPEETGSGAVEIIGNRFDVPPDFVSRDDLVPMELELSQVIDMEFTQYAYVIHDLNYRKNTKVILDYFKSVPNFNLLGRFATWNYKNMDLCMQDAFELAKILDEERSDGTLN